jgi:methyltransferase (TIGR00027 family)
LLAFIRGRQIARKGWSSDRAAGWLVRAEIEYSSPSTADLLASCTVAVQQVDLIRDRFLAGRPTIVPLEVSLESDGVLVAKARMTYYVRRSSFLKAGSGGHRPNILHKHILRSSARLVAGLRAREQMRSTPLFEDGYSAAFAGTHGRLLAEQFSKVLPELVDMVAARTRDADESLREAVKNGIRQVVSVGVGLDCRPFRLLAEARNITVFELDLPIVLEERERLLASLTDLPEVSRVPVAIDLEHQDLAGTLIQDDRFHTRLPTLFLVEGVSMYLHEDTMASVLRSIRSLMTEPNSRLWLDVVHSSVVNGTTRYPEVDRFVSEIGRLGEPFVFGVDRPFAYFAALGLSTLRAVASGTFSIEGDHPIFSLYSFHTLGPTPCGSL